MGEPTPGPWRVDLAIDDKPRLVWHDDADGYPRLVAEAVDEQAGQADGEAEANAELIAQAPQLRDENAELRDWVREAVDVLTKLYASGIKGPRIERTANEGRALLGEVSHD